MNKVLLSFFVTLISFSLSGQQKTNPTDTLKILGKIKKDLIFTLNDLDTFPTKAIDDLVLTNQRGEFRKTIHDLKGVLLKTLFENAEIRTYKPKELNEFYFIMIASDGYKAVFSWNEIFNTEIGNNLDLILEKDNKKIKEMDERILIASTKDFQTGRRFIKWLERIIVERAN